MPLIGSVHVSAALSNVAIKFKNPALVADQVAPVIPVVKESDKYYVFQREELRNMNSLRAAGAEANEVDWDVTSATYSAEEYALRHLLPERIVANADAPIRPRITTTEKLTQWILLGYEKRVQAIAQNTANVGGNAAATAAWDAASGQDPEADVDAAKTAVRQNAGVNPNAIMMSDTSWKALRRWLKSQSTNLTYREWVEIGIPPARIWDLDLIVAGGVENTANEGQADSISDIWNDNVLVFYRTMTPAIDSLSFMYTFRARAFRTRTWRNEEREGEYIESSFIQDEKLVASAAGYLITNTIA